MKRQNIFTALLTICFCASSIGLSGTTLASPQQNKDSQKQEKKTEDSAKSDKDDEKPKRRPRRGKREDLYGKKAKEVVAVFDSVISSASASTVRIMDGKRQIAIGTVVDSDGLILTKASELKGDVKCEIDGESKGFSATVIGVDKDTDLALLKIEKKNLPSIQWFDGDIPVIGQFVVSPLTKKTALKIGVVSVNAREIPTSGAFLGITMEDAPDGGVNILTVVENTPAAKAGLKPGDIITAIGDQKIEDIQGLRAVLGNMDPGDRIEIKYSRDKNEITSATNLTSRDAGTPGMDRSTTQNNMGSRVSNRRKDFAKALQHDGQLDRTLVGGPLLDLSGRVVGINIARSGRVGSLALPTEIVLPVIAKLKSGEFSPAIVNKEAISGVKKDIAALKKTLNKLPDDQVKLQRQLDDEKAKQKAYKELIKQLEEKIEDGNKNTKDLAAKSSAMKRSLRRKQTELKTLESRMQMLKTGKN